MTIEPPTYEVSAVVVNYNAGATLGECVASLKREGVKSVVVVDNGSTDDSLEWLALQHPGTKVIQSGRNLGYGGAANYGSRFVTGELLLICNPDLVLMPGALGAMVDRLARDPSLGLVGPALVGVDEGLQPSGRAFPTLGHSSLQALLGVMAPQNRYSRHYREANRATRRDRDCGLGDGRLSARSS